MTDNEIFELANNFFKELHQLGPGSEADTIKALDMVKNHLPPNAQIADIGCGTGAQTLVLAQQTTAQITAIDILPEFIATLDQRIKKHGLQDRIKTLKASMSDLPLEAEKMDMIWAEGAIYNIGFEEGLVNWRKFLKKGGYIVVSELSWLTKDRPVRLERFWVDKYPEINTIVNKESILSYLGYKVIGHFALSESSWVNYYEPFKNRITSFLDEEEKSNSAKFFVAHLQEEISFYEKYKDYYSYVFYIAQKV